MILKHSVVDVLKIVAADQAVIRIVLPEKLFPLFLELSAQHFDDFVGDFEFDLCFFIREFKQLLLIFCELH
jgi:hypothetical protein